MLVAGGWPLKLAEGAPIKLPLSLIKERAMGLSGILRATVLSLKRNEERFLLQGKIKVRGPGQNLSINLKDRGERLETNSFTLSLSDR